MKSKRDENEGDDNVDWEEAPVAGKCRYLTTCFQFHLMFDLSFQPPF